MSGLVSPPNEPMPGHGLRSLPSPLVTAVLSAAGASADPSPLASANDADDEGSPNAAAADRTDTDDTGDTDDGDAFPDVDVTPAVLRDLGRTPPPAAAEAGREAAPAGSAVRGRGSFTLLL